MAVAAFMLSMNVNAQEPKKKAKKAFWKNQSKAARKSVRKNARSMKRM